MWSKPILYRFRQSGKIPKTQALQGFAAVRLTLSRIQPRHSQTTRATNCANPGFLGIQFCFNCGQTCGQAVFLTTSTCGGSACIAGVSRDCGHGIFRLEGEATRSQSRRATNCATPRYEVGRSGWAYSPKCGAVPAPLYPVDSAVGDSPSIPHSGRDFKTFYRVPDHGPGMTVSTKEKAPSSQMVLFGAGDEARTRFPASREWRGHSREPCLTS